MKHISEIKSDSAVQQALLERMELASIDKQRIINYIKGNKIIELGCAGGNIISLIIKTLPNAHVTGIDYSPDLIKIAQQNNPKGTFFVRDIADWKDIKSFFGKYTTVVMSSFFHEIEAYFDTKIARHVIKESMQLLSSDGRIIVRDGVKPEHSVIIFRLKDRSIQKRLHEFQKNFVPSQVKITKQSDPNTYAMDSWDFHDFLCKYYFDEALWKEDLEERFGYHTEKEYLSLFLKDIKLIHVETYIAPYLKSRWENDFEILKGVLPHSHILLVGEKKLDK